MVVLLREPGKEHAEDPAVAPLCGGPSRNRPLRAPSRAEKSSGGTRGARFRSQIPPLEGTLTSTWLQSLARREVGAIVTTFGADREHPDGALAQVTGIFRIYFFRMK